MKLFPKYVTTGCASLALLATFQLVSCKARVDGASATKDLATKTSDGNIRIFYQVDSVKTPVVCMVTCSPILGQHFQEKTVGFSTPKGDTTLPGELPAGQRYCEPKMNCMDKPRFYNLYFSDAIGLGTLAVQQNFTDVIFDTATTTLDSTVNNWVNDVDAAMDRLATAMVKDPKSALRILAPADEAALINKLDPSLKENLDAAKYKHAAEIERRQKAENDRIAAEKAKAEEEARIKAEAVRKAEEERVRRIDEARRIARRMKTKAHNS